MNKKIFLFGVIILAIMFAITLSVVKQGSRITITPNKKPIIESVAIKLPVTENDPMFGNPGAPITITEFLSFECIDCAKRHEEIISFIEKNPGKARLVVKEIAKEDWLGNRNFSPLFALRCAQDQNQYWAFLNRAIKFKKFNESALNQIFTEINLDSTVFGNCLQNKNYGQEIEAEQTNLKILGFTQTPNIFINNKKVNLTDDVRLTNILKNIVAE